MTRRRRRLSNLFSALWNWLIGAAEESVPRSERMQAQVDTMLEALGSQADVASFAMALADQTRGQLTYQIDQVQRYEDAAAQYLRDAEEAKARQSLYLARQGKQAIVRLTKQLQVQQEEADRHAAAYAEARRKVDERRAQVPQIAHDERIRAVEVRLEATHGLDLNGTMEDFDAEAVSAELERLRLRNREDLTRDPAEQVRAELESDAAQSELDAEFARLKARVAGTPDEPSGAADVLRLEQDPVAQALALLERPRYVEFQRNKVLR